MKAFIIITSRFNLKIPSRDKFLSLLKMEFLNSFISKFLVIIVSLITPFFSFTAEETVNSRIQGEEIIDLNVSQNTFDVTDDKFWLIQGGFWSNEFDIQSVRNKITLGIDESNLVYESSSYAYRVTLDISYDVMENGSLVTKSFSNVSLEVDFDPSSGTTYQDRDLFSFTGGLNVQVSITDVEEDQSGVWTSVNTLKEAIFLENEITVERYYKFDQANVPDPLLSFSEQNGELIVSWPWVQGAEEYEVEWTWVNGYTGYKNGSTPEVETDVTQLDYDFIHNSSRVRVNGANSFSIPLIYGDGYLLVRYRGIGRGGVNYQIPLEGSWSSDALTGGDAGKVSEYGTINENYVLVSAHESNQYNYGAGISFIENGVKSVGVTYMDGVLKPRQSQAKLNSQEKIIVGSTIYDHHGRPAVGVMSAPVDQNSLGYVNDLNMYDSDGAGGAAPVPYDKDVFNKDVTFTECNESAAIPPMDDVSSKGAAYYYSDENNDTEGENAYLPDAEGYPFVHVQYTSDPTGRIKRVGGLGPNHQLGETYSTNDPHYTEYYYTTPDQSELWELFGNDADRNVNYTKVITKDVHGQISCAIIDQMGRTVATYMEGASPNGLETLSSNDGDDPVEKDFMDFNQELEPGNLVVQTPIVVTDPTQLYTFNYDFTGTSFTDCLPMNVCYDCVYEVEITILPAQVSDVEITDDLQNVLSDADGVVNFSHTLGSLSSFDTDCGENALVFSNENPGDETFDLKFSCVGEYYIIKELKVSDAPIDYYWEQYKSQSTCLSTYDDFLNDALSEIDYSACDDFEPCEANFLSEYGVESVYLTNNPGKTSQDYIDLKNDYLDDCGTVNSCDAFFPLLIADMSPGGQYGSTNTSDNLSVFNSTNNDLGGHWKSTGVTYYNTDGSLSYVDADGDGIQNDPPTDLTINQFLAQWQDSWAQSLIEFHPEYCYYSFCLDNPEIADFEHDMFAIETYSEACSSGYINPAESAGYFDFSICTNYQDDPVFETLYDNLSLSDQSAVDDIMNAEYDGKTIYQTAVEMAGDDYSTTVFGTGCNKDQHWQNFLNLYKSKRFQVIEIIKADYISDNCSSAECVGESTGGCAGNPFASSIPRGFTYESAMGYNLDNLSSTDWDQHNSDAQLELDTACYDMCEAQADTWMKQLEGCVNDLPSDQSWDSGQPYYDSIRVNLIEVCSNGCYNGCYNLTQFDNSVSTDSVNSIYSSFEDVLLHYIGTLSDDCTNLIIGNPTTQSDCGSHNYLNECACEALLDGDTDTEAEFEDVYGFVPDDFDKEQCLCDEYDSDDDGDIAGGELTNLNGDSIITVNNYPFCLSACINCLDITEPTNGLIDRFNSDYNINYYEDPILFTSFVNDDQQTNFTYEQILALIESCQKLDSSNTEPIFDFIGEEAFKLKELLDKLSSDDLSTDHLNYDHQILPEFFYTSLYANCTGDPSVEDFDYDQTIDVNDDLTFDLQGSNCSSCNITLEIVGGLPGQFSSATNFYSNIQSFGQVYIVMDDIENTSGVPSNFNVFRINVTVENDNGSLQDEVLRVTSCFNIVEELLDGNRDLYFEICSNIYQANTGNSCMENLIEQAELDAKAQHEEYLESQYEIFVSNYKEKCTQVTNEEFNLEYEANRYHYTLLYYDLSGNLIKTVPPKGVDKLTSLEVDQAIDYANGTGTAIYPSHSFETTYKHNSLNQVTQVTTPDGGTSKYWYDNVGRLVISQNAKQANDFYKGIMNDNYESGSIVDAYSYTIYDDIGRVTEVGEIIQDDAMTYDIAKDETDLTNWLDDDQSTSGEDVVKNNITLIYYDKLYDNEAKLEFGASYNEQTSRNRITATALISGYVETTSGSWVYPDPDYISHYNYDVHGNVRSYLQEVKELDNYNNQYRKTDYEYDLISGNPNYIWYQKGKKDQYIHHYKYDKDNRLKEVWTSDDAQVWDRDANYEYREDGYLVRTEIGDLKVQGMDYAYTLHGWLKSLNSGVLNPDYDMGKDGKTNPTVEYDNYEDDIHALHARDVLSYTINYYNGDYKAITNGVSGYDNHLVSISGSNFESDIDELFNGNITSIITSTTDYNGNKQDPLASTYHYDQLHRFTESHVFTANDITSDNNLDNATRNNTTGPGGLGDYEVHVDYDQNGNITALNRMAEGVGNNMDQFTYNYTSGTNKLDYVSDAVTTTGGSGYGDIQNGQITDNYEYHSDGSLRADEQEEIDYIDWYPNGKIKRIYRNAIQGQSDVYFEYDAMGIRTLKVEMTRLGGTSLDASDDWKYTYYGSDANGVTMAIYDVDPSASEMKRIESMIYGGARLGMDTEPEIVSTAADYVNDCNNDGLSSGVLKFTPGSINNGDQVDLLLDGVVYASITFNTSNTLIENMQELADDINDQKEGFYAEVLDYTLYAYLRLKETIAGSIQSKELTLEINSVDQPSYVVRDISIGECHENRILGDKFFELTNHLGNVMEVVSDRKVAVEKETDYLCLDYTSSENAVSSAFGVASMSNEMSIAAWVKTTSTSNQAIATYYEGGTTDKGGSLAMNNGYVTFDGRNGTSTYYSSGASTTDISDGEWHYVVGTVTGSHWKIYVDGQLENENDQGTSGSFSGMNEPFTIGSSQSGGYFTGCVREVSLWDYEKSASEVLISYSTYSGYNGSEAGIAGYWKVEEGSGININDETSGNHDLTSVATATWETGAVGLIDYYEADIVSYSDYYPFGMQMPGRKGFLAGADYRYKFNGMESDKEVSGEGNSYTTQFRQYDPRLGRWKSLDPLAAKFPSESPYVGFGNNPILYTDPLGLEKSPSDNGSDKSEVPNQMSVSSTLDSPPYNPENTSEDVDDKSKNGSNFIFRESAITYKNEPKQAWQDDNPSRAERRFKRMQKRLQRKYERYYKKKLKSWKEQNNNDYNKKQKAEFDLRHSMNNYVKKHLEKTYFWKRYSKLAREADRSGLAWKRPKQVTAHKNQGVAGNGMRQKGTDPMDDEVNLPYASSKVKLRVGSAPAETGGIYEVTITDSEGNTVLGTTVDVRGHKWASKFVTLPLSQPVSGRIKVTVRAVVANGVDTPETSVFQMEFIISDQGTPLIPVEKKGKAIYKWIND